MADLQSAALATWPRSHLPKYYLYRINAIDRCTVPSKALSKLTEPHYLQHDYHSIGRNTIGATYDSMTKAFFNHWLNNQSNSADYDDDSTSRSIINKRYILPMCNIAHESMAPEDNSPHGSIL